MIIYVKVQECEHSGDLEDTFNVLSKAMGQVLDYGVNEDEEVGWIKFQTSETVNDVASLLLANESTHGFAYCTTYRPDYAR